MHATKTLKLWIFHEEVSFKRTLRAVLHLSILSTFSLCSPISTILALIMRTEETKACVFNSNSAVRCFCQHKNFNIIRDVKKPKYVDGVMLYFNTNYIVFIKGPFANKFLNKFLIFLPSYPFVEKFLLPISLL